MSLLLRDAVPEDAAALAALYQAAIECGEAMLDGLPKGEAVIRAWIEALGEREAWVVLEDAGEPVGWGLVRRYSDRAGYYYCGETFVYVRPDQRRHGYGTRLQEAVVARCRAYQYHHLLARIWATNTASLAFHEQAGYEVVGVQREIATMRGQWQDLVVLQQVLDDA